MTTESVEIANEEMERYYIGETIYVDGNYWNVINVTHIYENDMIHYTVQEVILPWKK